ncbi:MAG: DHH family phosphoesterase [Candidatus Thorarchaeota archaeon]
MSSDTSSSAQKTTTLLSISHDKDVDGLASAAIVRRYAKSKGLDYDVILTDYGGFEKVFGKVAAYRNALIVVTDLGMDESQLENVISGLSRAISQGCRIVWLDHHQWSNESAKRILSLENKPVLKVNHDHCAAEIAFKVLLPRDEISKELAVIAHDTDFNLRELEVANSLADALSVIRFGALDKREDLTQALKPLLISIADEGPTGIWNQATRQFKDPLLSKRVENYRKERLKKIRKALAAHCDHEIHGRLVRIIEMPSGVTTTDMGTFLTDPGNLNHEGEDLSVADLLITISQGGMLGFRRGTERVSCSAAAKLFNGGGHPYAAGGEYGMYDNFAAACDDIFLILSKDQSWLEET